MEDIKNTKDDKKEKESAELNDKLSEEELKEVSGGASMTPLPGLPTGTPHWWTDAIKA